MNQLQELPSPLLPVHTREITPNHTCCVIYRYPTHPNSRAERQLQQLIGRHAAREACYLLAETQNPGTCDPALYRSMQIPTGSLGEPVFPTTFRGSISHTLGCGGAIVGNPAAYQSIGIDLEMANRILSPAVERRIIRKSEAVWCGTPPPETLSSYALAFFTAKEAIVKTLSPLLRRPVVLDEVGIHWSPHPGAQDDGGIVGHFTLQPDTLLAAEIAGTVTGTTALLSPLVISIATLATPSA